MYRVPVDEEGLIVPGAGHLAEPFLGTVLEFHRRSGLGLPLTVVPPGGRMRLQAPVRFRNGWWRGLPHLLEVRADPVGTGLDVGWMLAVEDQGLLRSLLGGPGPGRELAERADAGAQATRARLTLTRSFHDLVLLPAVDVLVAEVEGRPVRRRPR